MSGIPKGLQYFALVCISILWISIPVGHVAILKALVDSKRKSGRTDTDWRISRRIGTVIVSGIIAYLACMFAVAYSKNWYFVVIICVNSTSNALIHSLRLQDVIAWFPKCYK